MDFLTIDGEYSFELVVQRSKFISFLFPCQKLESFQEKLNQIKKNYHDATHIIPVYRLLSNKRQIKEHYSDDKEPAKTAGWPILYLLQQKKLIQIGVIVVRYFGGIKLGTSGLQKAYTEVVMKALEKAKIIKYKSKVNITIIIPIEKEYIFHESITRQGFENNVNLININYFEEKNLNYASITLETDEETNINLYKYIISKIDDAKFLVN